MLLTPSRFSPFILFFLDLFFILTVSNFIFDSLFNSIWIVLFVMVLFSYEKIYTFRFDFWVDLKKILKSIITSFFIVSTIIYFSNYEKNYSYFEVFNFFIILLILFPIFKRYSKKLIFKINLFKQNVNVLASEPHKTQLLKEINSNWYLGLRVTNKRYQMVLISSKKYDKDKLESVINKYSKRIKDVFIIPYIDSIDFSSSNIIDYSNIKLSAIHLENKLLDIKNIIIKYLFEKILTILILPFVLILHIFISILIKKDSEGKIFFKQKRLGKNGKIFRVYKYRTMYENQDEILDEYLKNNPEEIEYYKIYHKYKNDPRITKIGRFLRNSSLDEFPQFYNVLRGDMNLIGPRPYMIKEEKAMSKSYKNIILKVRPGLTGLWQVSGRNELTFKRRLELEKWYIQNWSLWMDFVIFIKTMKVVLLKIGSK